MDDSAAGSAHARLLNSDHAPPQHAHVLPQCHVLPLPVVVATCDGGAADGHIEATTLAAPTDPEAPEDPREHIYVRAMLWVCVLVFISELSFTVSAVTVLPDLLIAHYNGGVSCSGSVSESDPACKRANAAYTLAASIVTSLGCLLAFMGSPMLGVVADAYGRRVPLLLCGVLNLMQQVALLGFAYGVVPLEVYYAATILAALDPTSVCLAYLSDAVPPHRRAYAFGSIFASVALSIIIGPFIGAAVSMHVSFLIGMGVMLLAFVVVLLIPESLAPHLRVPFALSAAINPVRSFGVLRRFRMFRMLALVVFFNEMAVQGKSALVLSFLKERFGMSNEQFAYVALTIGVAGVLSQSVVLKGLVRVFSTKQVMLIGLSSGALCAGIYTIMWLEWQVYIAELVACCAYISFPAISAMKSNNVGAKEQGRIQGALFGVKQLGGGLGPVVFGAAWSASTGDGAAVHLPQLAWLLATGVALTAVGLGAGVPQDVDPAEKQRHEEEVKKEEQQQQEQAELHAEDAENGGVATVRAHESSINAADDYGHTNSVLSSSLPRTTSAKIAPASPSLVQSVLSASASFHRTSPPSSATSGHAYANGAYLHSDTPQRDMKQRLINDSEE